VKTIFIVGIVLIISGSFLAIYGYNLYRQNGCTSVVGIDLPRQPDVSIRDQFKLPLNGLDCRGESQYLVYFVIWMGVAMMLVSVGFLVYPLLNNRRLLAR